MTGTGVYENHTITAIGNGWYRCTITGNSGDTNTNYGIRVCSTNANNSTTRVNNSKYWLWGGQGNSGIRATDYVSTTATASSTLRIEADGALIEGTRINLAKQSENFGVTWAATNVTVTANNAVAPDGLTTADLLTASNANGTVLQAIATTAVWYGFSVYLKRKTGTGNIDICADDSAWVTQTINSTTWTRCWVGVTVDADATHSPGIRIVTNGDEVWAWGAQYEAGSVAAGNNDSWISSYIPTVRLSKPDY